MSSTANLGFIARHLMQSEFPGRQYDEIDGGILAWGDDLWAGIWEVEAVGNVEEFIRETQAAAAEKGKRWAGAILMIPPSLEKNEQVSELAEALFIYGMPRSQGLGSGGPDVIQTLNKPQAAAPRDIHVISTPDDDDRVKHLLAETWNAEDRLLSVAWGGASNWQPMMRTHLAVVDDEPAGIAGTIPGDLIGRLAALWVTPAFRGRQVGHALVNAAHKLAAERNLLALSAWTYRDGTLRYYLSKQGFEDQLSAQYYLAED